MLPNLPRNNTKTEIETIAFRGLNLTENTREGDFSSSRGITLDSYPCLKSGNALEDVDGYTSPSDLFEFDGHVAVVDENVLYFDGEKIASVTNEKKQWTVVNRKIVLFPDKLLINVDTGEWEPMNSRTESSGDITFKDNVLTAAVSPTYKSGYKQDFTGAKWADGQELSNNYMYVYKNISRSEIEAKWNELSSVPLTLVNAINNDKVSVGDIFIPVNEGDNFFKADVALNSSELKDPLSIKSDFYCVVTSVTGEYYNVSGVVNYRSVIYFDVCKIGRGSERFSDVFSVAQTVDVKLADEIVLAKKTKITDISQGETNSITFASAFSVRFLLLVTATSESGNVYVQMSSSLKFQFAPDEPITKGSYVVIENFEETRTGNVIVYDPDTKTYKTYACTSTSSGTSGNKLNATNKELKITIERNIPDLDFVCERGNRLWGVSNSDRTIYASALGDPSEFWQYDLVATDAYALAIGSEGEFTGICSHGAATVIFKENIIYKILGSYPEEFYNLDYQFSGLQKGCERSLVVINETLFYKGKTGIYAFASSAPQLISYSLGTQNYGEAVASHDGKNYVIYLRKSDGSGGVYCYDTIHGSWVQFEETKPNERIKALDYINGAMHYLVETDEMEAGIISTKRKIKKQNENPSESWMCELVKTDESTFYNKIYTKLYISAELDVNSSLRIYIKLDGEEYQKVYEKLSESKTPLVIPLLLPRTNSFQLKLEGTGAVLVRKISREMHVGGGK